MHFCLLFIANDCVANCRSSTENTNTSAWRSNKMNRLPQGTLTGLDYVKCEKSRSALTSLSTPSNCRSICTLRFALFIITTTTIAITTACSCSFCFSCSTRSAHDRSTIFPNRSMRCTWRILHDETLVQWCEIQIKTNETHLVSYGHRCFVASSGSRLTLDVHHYRLANAAAVDPSLRWPFRAARAALWFQFAFH